MRGLSRTFRKYERRIYLVVTALIAVGFFLTYESVDYSGRESREQVGAILGKPVTRAELHAVAGHVDLLAAMDAFARSPILSANRAPWLAFLVRQKSAQGKPQSSPNDMWSAISRYYGIAPLADLSTQEARDREAWKWIAYLRAADRAGIQVTADDLLAFIHAIASGRRPGEFDRRAYMRLVESGDGLRVPVEVFERAAAEYLRVEKYFDAIGDAAVVSHQEILDAYVDRHREVEIAYLDFDPQDSAAAVKAPTREAVAAFFKDPARRSAFKIPAKAQVEFLLAEREAFLPPVEPPVDADVKARYEADKEQKYKNPDGGRDGKPLYKPLEDVREQIAKDLRLERAGQKGFEVMKKVLHDIGALEAEAHAKRGGGLDLAKLAETARVTRGVTHFFDESQADEAEKMFGAFKEWRDRQAFRRRLFGERDERGQRDDKELMKDGDIMPGEREPVATDKGWLIYRLVRRKPERVPQQLTADVEEDVIRQLRRDAASRMATDEALRGVELVNAQGLAAAEGRLGRTFHRAPPVQRAQPSLPNPAGAPGDHPHAKEIVDQAFRLRQQGKVGKAAFVDAGPQQPKFVVVLARALEARMDNFALEKGAIQEELLANRVEGQELKLGKRQILVDEERRRLEKEIQRPQPEPAKPGPAGG